MTDKAETKVAFRKYPDGEVIALFVEEVDERFKSCEAYTLTDNYLPADLELIDYLPPASEEEYRETKLRLESEGHHLNVA